MEHLPFIDKLSVKKTWYLVRRFPSQPCLMAASNISCPGANEFFANMEISSLWWRVGCSVGSNGETKTYRDWWMVEIPPIEIMILGWFIIGFTT
jgi:hypothetical protein